MLFTKVHEYFRDRRSDKMPTEAEMQQKLLALLESKNWDVRRAAKQLGMTRESLYRIIRERPNVARAMVRARADIKLKKLS